jgi:hypothetical protein
MAVCDAVLIHTVRDKLFPMGSMGIRFKKVVFETFFTVRSTTRTLFKDFILKMLKKNCMRRPEVNSRCE